MIMMIKGNQCCLFVDLLVDFCVKCISTQLLLLYYTVPILEGLTEDDSLFLVLPLLLCYARRELAQPKDNDDDTRQLLVGYIASSRMHAYILYHDYYYQHTLIICRLFVF